jgi:hypothetical protein
MKTRKYLYSSVLTLGLTVGAAPSYAAPMFDNAETSGLCLAESIVSIFATLTEHQGCGGVAGPTGVAVYPVTISADPASGVGEAIVASFGGSTTLTNKLSGGTRRGVFCNVQTPGGVINGAKVTDYLGYLPFNKWTHSWNGDRTIMISGATLKLDKLDFDEHNIKDFYPTKDPLVFTDKGLEVITKGGYPRSKWKQTSKYKRPDGGIGSLHFDKWPITPVSSCKITLDLEGDNPGGTWEFDGTVTVQR